MEKTLRDEFLEICYAQDRPASQVIREFMQNYIARKADGETKKAIKVRQPDEPERR